MLNLLFRSLVNVLSAFVHWELPVLRILANGNVAVDKMLVLESKIRVVSLVGTISLIIRMHQDLFNVIKPESFGSENVHQEQFSIQELAFVIFLLL